MDYMEIWNKICEFEIKNSSTSFSFCSISIEEQKFWENIFSECLGYGELKAETSSQEEFYSDLNNKEIPNLIVKNGNEKLFAAEIKNSTSSISKSLRQQIADCLKQQDFHIGILICDRIFILNVSDDTEVEIYFFQGNPEGAKLMELFHKKNFSEDKVKEFIAQKNRTDQNIKNLCEEISNSKDLIIKLLENEFAPKYGKTEFDNAMKEFEIQIAKTSVVLNAVWKDIKFVGNDIFVSYYEQFANPNFDARDVKQIWKDRRCNSTKASMCKWIIKNGYGKEALQMIANIPDPDFSRISFLTDTAKRNRETKHKARELLEKLF